MIILSFLGGALIGNGLATLWLGHGWNYPNIAALEVAVGILLSVIRAFQLGRDSR